VDYFCADIYSFGVLAHLMLTGNVPFHDCDPYKLPILHSKNKLQVQKRTFGSQQEHLLQDLMLQCLSKDPKNRPLASELYSRLYQVKALQETKPKSGSSTSESISGISHPNVPVVANSSLNTSTSKSISGISHPNVPVVANSSLNTSTSKNIHETKTIKSI